MEEKRYQLRITNGSDKHTTYRYRKALKRRGFVFRGGTAWTIDGSKRFVNKKKRYAKRKKLTFTIVETKYVRSSNYRDKWFEKNKPVFGFYLCTYCGRLVRAKNITVDHIIPVAILKYDNDTAKQYKKTLKKMGCKNVNDIGNLCGSCFRCNEEKKSKTGKWVDKGRRYRHKFFRIGRFILKMALILIVIIALVLFGFFLSGRSD
ncbi:MAG: HNH endonuclease [Lachnospiraceae bacterium]|nr:HNH endonuclease [Lachnospiraceae bacterium]